MVNHEVHEIFRDLSTALVADACVRVGLDPRVAPPGMRALSPYHRAAGRARPVRHYGSVDIFLEALEDADSGDVLVVDNGGRADEGCLGDLTVLEAQGAGISGIVVWGCHRDNRELIQIGLPVFSYGTAPVGPRRLDPREGEALRVARLGNGRVRQDDYVFADGDGAIVVASEWIGRVLATARTLWKTERRQAAAIVTGTTLREQLQFEGFLARRRSNPGYTFRKHLRRVGGAIEE